MLQRNIIVDNLNINFCQSNSLDVKNTLVFLHGWGSNALVFKNVFEKCDSFIALDLPGFGKSDFPETAWNVSDYAIFFRNFLEKLEIKNPILAGHSFGGSIAIKHNVKCGASKKNILIGTSGFRKRPKKLLLYKVGAKIFKIVFSFPGLNLLKNKAREKFYESIGSADYINSGKLKETYKKIISEDLSDDMKKVSAETILIWGENDAETPLEDGKKINNLIKNSKLFVIKNAGHYVFFDQPEEFNKIFHKEIC